MALNKEDLEKILAETLQLQHNKEEPFDQILVDADKLQEDLMHFALNEAPNYYKWEMGIQVRSYYYFITTLLLLSYFLLIL